MKSSQGQANLSSRLMGADILDKLTGMRIETEVSEQRGKHFVNYRKLPIKRSIFILSYSLSSKYDQLIFTVFKVIDFCNALLQKGLLL